MKYPLNPEQQEAVDTTEGPILVLAGAGSGKTRVVTCRSSNSRARNRSRIHLGADVHQQSGSGDEGARQLLTSRHVFVCTFHSLGARILRETIHVLGYRRDFTIYDDQDVEKIIKLCLSEKESLARTKRDFKLHLQGEKCPHRTESLEELQSSITKMRILRLFKATNKNCSQSNAVDFDDLLYLPVKIFRAHPEILEHYQNRWNFLMIDEYQDTNETQSVLIRLLVEKHKTLCVVGDPDQSIYSWRGANIDNILSFSQAVCQSKSGAPRTKLPQQNKYPRCCQRADQR